ncbi:nitronate monooxygenase [Erwinia sp. HR93]|uniref:NAD(P)H-dependent flavin oxidoreductase n=1 Tax=Erwinia sp. HR93 TaxID=3094840 RepID=UPI002ADEC9B9|nr:nitronate monooxygenase [Erwinia sp. HR93]MEA1063046.1 nitronate monooxygenase [Erwinia sp. HR93]
MAFTLTDLPFIQAPMAGVSTPQLAAAVSNAGALGSISLGAASLSQARDLLLETQTLTARPVNINLFCHAPARRNPQRESAWIDRLRPTFARFGAAAPEHLTELYRTFINNAPMLELLLAARPAIVSFHFGLPDSAAIRAFKRAGITMLACATSVDEAKRIAAVGIDMVVAQGIEAGGHRGIFNPRAPDERLPTLALVRAIKAATQLPIIAAGGIMNGADITEALKAGAVAAQLGTAFILCPESSADAGWRERLRHSKAHATALTCTISGRPARGIINSLYLRANKEEIADYPLAYDAAKALHRAAVAQGCHDYGAYWAGCGCHRSREMPAARLVDLLANELQ